MKTLFEPVKFKNLEMRNRLVRSATWESVANLEGVIGGDAYRIYRELAFGGVGLIITGFTSVAANDYYFGGMMRLSSDKLIPYYKKLTDIAHEEGCPIFSQLALGAYYKRISGELIEVAEDDLTTEEIDTVVKMFVAAAGRAKAAGFDGVQLHAAHFFFLSRFISPHYNHRADSYGGSPENRVRILLEILDGIKKIAPELHVSIKINCNDFQRDGLDEIQSLEICKILAAAGVDSIEVSGNGTSVRGVRTYYNEGYFSYFAIQLAETVDVPVICVGGWRSRGAMEKILRDSKVELISLSRPLIREPNLPKKFQSGESMASQCASCNACYSSPMHRCVFQK